MTSVFGRVCAALSAEEVLSCPEAVKRPPDRAPLVSFCSETPIGSLFFEVPRLRVPTETLRVQVAEAARQQTMAELNLEEIDQAGAPPVWVV